MSCQPREETWISEIHNSQPTYQSIGSEPPDASVLEDVGCGWRAAVCSCSGGTAERSRLARMSSAEEGMRETSARSSSGTSAEGRDGSAKDRELPPAGKSRGLA